MPWHQLYSWYVDLRRGRERSPMPLTLVTLRALDGASEEELAFYSSAEFDALVDWAMKGRFVMAFVADDREELTLLCTEPIAVMQAHVGDLPLVAAGLAEADLRQVSMVRLTGPAASLH